MRPDIALAGFVLTAAEWDELDPQAREELLAAATPDDPWIVTRAVGLLASAADR